MRLTDKKNNYKRPKVTIHDEISSDINLIKKKLEGYVQIHPDNFKDIDTGIWIKYITSDNKYRSGGVLINNKAPDYFVLKNNYKNLSWSVTLKDTLVFMKDVGKFREKMIERNNLYRLYEADYIKILEEPDQELVEDN